MEMEGKRVYRTVIKRHFICRMQKEPNGWVTLSFPSDTKTDDDG